MICVAIYLNLEIVQLKIYWQKLYFQIIRNDISITVERDTAIILVYQKLFRTVKVHETQFYY